MSFQQGERKVKTAFLKSLSPLISCTSHAGEPLPALLHLPFILQRKNNGDFHRSSLCRISFPAERHWINLPPSRFVQKFSSFRSWCLARRKIERSCCLWFQWCVTSVVGFFFPLYILAAHKKSICGVDFTHNISISHFCEGLFSIG